MNKLKEFAEKLNGREYLDELTKELETYAKENGIVVVFGQSDDLMELRGAIDDEFGCYDGGIFYIRQDGQIYAKESGIIPLDVETSCKEIEAVWCPKGTEYSWGYKTDIPHETFAIMEDGEHYCKGIVFYLKNLEKTKTNFEKITESVESLAEFIEKYATNCLYCPLYKLEKCKVTGWKPESELCKKELAEWLQKECENGI